MRAGLLIPTGRRRAAASSSRVQRLVLCGLLVAGGCAAPSQSIYTLPPLQPAAGPPGALTHRVARGETLWAISRRYHVPYREIMRANNITDVTQVPAGRVLVIPRPQAPKVRIPLFENPRWTHVVVHHSAMKTGNAAIIDRSHRKRGFRNGLGYHFVIDNGTARRRDGQIEVGPRWFRQHDGAHCNAGGMNQHGIGICLIGDFTHRPPSAAQMDALVSLVKQLRGFYRIPAKRVVAHRDVPGKSTACPGDRFPWAAFMRRVR